MLVFVPSFAKVSVTDLNSRVDARVVANVDGRRDGQMDIRMDRWADVRMNRKLEPYIAQCLRQAQQK